MISISDLQKFVGEDELCMWIISSIVFSIFYSFINIFTFKYLFDVNCTKKRLAIFIAIDSIIKSICTIFVPAPYYRLLNMILSVILLKVVIGGNTAKCIVGEATNFITIICLEILFLKVFEYLYTDISSYIEGMYDFVYKTSMVIGILAVKLVIYAMVRKNETIIKISEHLSRKIKDSIILVSSIEILLIFFNFVEMAIYISDFPYSILVLDIFFLATYFYYSIKFILKAARLEEQDTVIENLEAYNKTLSIMYDRIRCFKHDFSNFVQALDGYAKTDDLKGIKSMTTSVLKQCKSVNSMGILNPKALNNPAIYSIITSKYYTATEEMVQMNIEVMFNVGDIGVDAYDFCVILGILLDNAIEAAKESDEKVVNVKFQRNKKNNKVVIIENSYKDKDIDISKIFEKGYSTKPESPDHGLGLWNVKRILSHTSELELFTSRGKMFKQEIEMYDV